MVGPSPGATRRVSSILRDACSLCVISLRSKRTSRVLPHQHQHHQHLAGRLRHPKIPLLQFRVFGQEWRAYTGHSLCFMKRLTLTLHLSFEIGRLLAGTSAVDFSRSPEWARQASRARWEAGEHLSDPMVRLCCILCARGIRYVGTRGFH